MHADRPSTNPKKVLREVDFAQDGDGEQNDHLPQKRPAHRPHSLACQPGSWRKPKICSTFPIDTEQLFVYNASGFGKSFG